MPQGTRPLADHAGYGAHICGTYEGKSAHFLLDDGALDALARELGIARARPGESMQAFIGRIQAAQNGRGSLH